MTPWARVVVQVTHIWMTPVVTCPPSPPTPPKHQALTQTLGLCMCLSGNRCHRVQCRPLLQHGPRHGLVHILYLTGSSGHSGQDSSDSSMTPGHQQGPQDVARPQVSCGLWWHCEGMGINIDLSCSRIMGTDMVLGSSLSLAVTTTPGDDKDQPVWPQCQHGSWTPTQSQEAAQASGISMALNGYRRTMYESLVLL